MDTSFLIAATVFLWLGLSLGKAAASFPGWLILLLWLVDGGLDSVGVTSFVVIVPVCVAGVGQLRALRKVAD